MKIYQIHETGGQYEDYFDYIVGSYLSKEKAEQKKLELEKLEEVSHRCENCQIFFCNDNNDLDVKNNIKHAKIDCYDADITIENDIVDCSNYESSWDYSSFKIKEVEVIE